MQYKTAVVTGASSGIGKAIADQLCRNGVKVFGLARSKQKLQELKKTLPKDKRELFVVTPCDISKQKSAEKVLDKIFKNTPIDLVVNNAGIGFSKNFSTYTDEEINAVVNTNLYGTVTVTRAALASKPINHHVHIVNVTSLAGKAGFPQLSIYSATKFALEGLTEALRQEYDDKDASFTVLRPGITDTAFFNKAGMKDFRDTVKDTKAYYSPEKVATIFLSKLHKKRKTITIGNDKLFIALLPFIPFSMRFKVLDVINKL